MMRVTVENYKLKTLLYLIKLPSNFLEEKKTNKNKAEKWIV